MIYLACTFGGHVWDICRTVFVADTHAGRARKRHWQHIFSWFSSSRYLAVVEVCSKGRLPVWRAGPCPHRRSVPCLFLGGEGAVAGGFLISAEYPSLLSSRGRLRKPQQCSHTRWTRTQIPDMQTSARQGLARHGSEKPRSNI